jgi:hypothetical protein
MLCPRATRAAAATITPLNPVSYEVTVTASVGEPKLNLWGFTSPRSLIKLEGVGVSEETTADLEGYFFFDRAFLPQPLTRRLTENTWGLGFVDLSLVGIDQTGRTTFPLSLPPLPVGPFEITIGPVLLGPTLSLEKGSFLQREQIRASGSTIPNAEVSIFLANEFGKSIFPQAQAYFLPKYQIQSDQFGNFEFNLPAGRPAKWRIFAAVSYFRSAGPKSNTLTFRVLALWQWLWQEIRERLQVILQPYLWPIVIGSELLILLMIVRAHRLRSIT